MKSVKYDPRFKFSIILYFFGYSQSMSVKSTKKLYRELGEVLKKIPPEEHEDIRFGVERTDAHRSI